MPVPGLRLCLELAADGATSTQFLVDSLADVPSLNRRFLVLAGAFLPEMSPVPSTRAALDLLTAGQTADLLWVLALSDAMQAPQTRSSDRLWKHSLLTAATVRQVRQHLAKPPRGSAWVAGMAHDIGHLLMPGPATGQGIDWHAEHDRLADQNPGPLPSRNHCLTGGSLLSFWNAPPPLVDTARFHHQPATADAKSRAVVALVRLADLIAEHVDAENLREELALEQSSAWKIVDDWCGLKSQSAEQLIADVLIPASVLAERWAGLLAK